MNRKMFALGSISALLSVALGAFGAHALELSARFAATYETAADYHMSHSLALLAIAVIWDKIGGHRLAVWAGRCIAAGIVLFSGSLYVLSITGITWLGAITPLGGVAFIIGWALAAAAVLRGRR